MKYISQFIQFNSVDSIINNEKFKMLSEKEKQYSHYLIKDKYINSNSLIGIDDIKVDNNDEINFNDAYYSSNFCVFKDELNRNLVALTEYSNNKYFPKIYQLENKEEIQTFTESSTKTNLFYHKDVLDLYDVKDYLFICNFNYFCLIFLLDKSTKLFKPMKVLENYNLYLKVIPNNNLKDNSIILYDHINGNNQMMYYLETDNTEIIADLKQLFYKYYSSYYDYDRMNNNENIYILECSRNTVRLYYTNIDNEKCKVFYLWTKDSNYINHAIIIKNNNNKQLYCSSYNRKIFIFDYQNQTLIKKIDNTGSYIVRLSTSSILCYDCNSYYEFKIIDTDSETISKTIALKNKDYYFYALNPIILNMNNNYLSLMTYRNGLSFVKIE